MMRCVCFPWACLALSFTVIACGGDTDGGLPGDLAETAAIDTTSGSDGADSSTAETASPDSGAADTTPADTVPASEVGADSTTSACSEADLEACEYPSLGLNYAERDGIATIEPVTGRSLPLFARIPARPGPLPVVLWSHGGGFSEGGQLSSDAWGEVLARHGYVVIHIGHAPLGVSAAQALCVAAEVPEGECVRSDDEDDNGLVAIGRSFDVAAVLDDLARLSQLSVANDGPALDLDRVAVAGWSGGSRGPMVIMGAKVKPTANAPVFTNPKARAKAAIFMSPAGPTFGGWFETESGSSWDALRGPTLTCTGTNDQKVGKPELTGAIRRASFPAQPADGTRWLLYSNLAVGVGGHSTYNLEDQGSSDLRLERLSRAIGSGARAFLDAHLRGNAGAKAWLASDYAKILAGDVDWQHR